MKIYLDLVFLINFMFDFLLLLTVKIIFKRQISILKILLGALVGTISIFFLFFSFSTITLFLFKILLAIIMISITFGKQNFGKNFLGFYFVSILLGGFLYYLNLEFSYQNIGLVFFRNRFHIPFLLLLFLSPIVLYFYIRQTKELKIKMNCYYEVELYYHHKIYSYQAYLDTGNQLYDLYSHKPVILLYDPYFPAIRKKMYIPYKTLDHSGILECFKAEKIILNHDIEISKPLIAFSKNSFQIKDVDMILHSDYL